MIEQSDHYGFNVLNAYAFRRRGDFGENRYEDILLSDIDSFYEYLLILTKTGDAVLSEEKIVFEFSSLASVLTEEHGFRDQLSFFQWHKSQFGDSFVL